MAKINIYGELHNDTPSGFVTSTQQIMDTELGKRQSEINAEFLSESVNTSYLICSTSGDAAIKTVSCPGFLLSTNVRLLIKMEHAHTNTEYTPTLNIEGTGNEGIIFEGSVASYINTWADNEVLDIYFDGTQYIAQRTNNKVGSSGYCECDTPASTPIKIVNDYTILSGFELGKSVRVLIKMINPNTSTNPTLNINGTGAKEIEYNGSEASDSNSWVAGEVLDVYYDGTKYIACTQGEPRFSTGEKLDSIGIDNEPVEGSENLVKSGSLFNIKKQQDTLNTEIQDSIASGDQNTSYTTCDTLPGTVIKVINNLQDFKLSTNIHLLVKMINQNTATNPTLNINGTGAKGMVYNGKAASNSNTWVSGEVLDVYYDGTKYILSTHGSSKFNTGEGLESVGIDNEPVRNSGNLVKSGSLFNIKEQQDTLNTEIQNSIASGDENTAYTTCKTTSSTVAKVIDDLPNFKLSTNIHLLVKMINPNTIANPTLNINGTGAKGIIYNGGAVSSGNTWKGGEILDIYYDGTQYIANTYGSSKFATGQKVDETRLETTPVQGSNNIITSGGIYTTVEEINNKIDAIISGVNVSLSISPNIIYKGTATGITLTGTMSNGTPTLMRLLEGSSQLKTSTTSPITYTTSITMVDNTKTYTVTGITTTGLTLSYSTTVSARNPIYYGFGVNSDAVVIAANKLGPTTTANRTYDKSNGTGETCNFFIMIPNDIGVLTNFTMNGAPFVMKPSRNEIKGGITYHVYESANVYANGVRLIVAAS